MLQVKQLIVLPRRRLIVKILVTLSVIVNTLCYNSLMNNTD